MKSITLFILAAMLFVSLTFAGMAFFGMDHDGMMGDLECVNHCIDVSTIPSVMSTAIPELLVVFFVVLFVHVCLRRDYVLFPFASKCRQRLTEPIRLFLLSQNLATIVLRN